MRHTWTVNDFPIGFEQIHPEQSINFQLNRLYHFSGDPVLLAQLRRRREFVTSHPWSPGSSPWPNGPRRTGNSCGPPCAIGVPRS